ncbi:MAG TPA: hypothetical protein VEA69_17745 [Tepidisphaeraceae bacterium]|nr:hypothetical protein [Tepidisphaeraceae bacterium]
MRPSSNLIGGTFHGAEIEPGTFHTERPAEPAPVRSAADDALIAPTPIAPQPH